MGRILFPGLFILWATWCTAQNPLPAPIIESTGTATVHAQPTQVDFWLIRSYQDAQLDAAMSAALAFEGAFRKEVAERDLRPIDIEVSAPAIEDLNEKTVKVAARLRYAMSGFANPDTGPRAFASLCDKIAALGADLWCAVKGPILDVQNRDTLLRSAVSAATENAYPAADAVAGVLRSAVSTVDSVRVVEVTWNQTPGAPFPPPTLRQMSCTAKVAVLYTAANP